MSKFNFPNEPVSESASDSHVLIDLSCTTPEGNFACKGVARALNRIYEDYQANNVVWQPDVLWETRKIAEQIGIEEIVDVGCGNGSKLVHYFPVEKYKTVGVDFHGSLELCRGKYPERHWIECDLTSYDDLARVTPLLESENPQIFVLSDVIEHLTDPRPLISWIRSRLIANPDNRFIVSTPDRLRLGYGDMNAIPPNESHVREWSLSELKQFFASAGFEIVRSGHTRANQFDLINSSIFIELKCSAGFYHNFLVETGLVYGSCLPEHVLVTGEYAEFHNTGGIGTFVKEQREAYGFECTLCLIMAEPDENQGLEQYVRTKAIGPQLLLSGPETADLPKDDIALKALLQIVFYFPELRSVQYADYQGLGCRIAQAKRVGMLPDSLTVIAFCHGMTHYLENAHETWFGLTHVSVAEKEKISVENADQVVFPTYFLKQLYSEAGIRVQESKAILLRYPFHSSQPVVGETSPVDTLVFYGKRSKMKGFELFLQALHYFGLKELNDNGIRKIVIIGPKVHDNEQTVAMLADLRQAFHVEEHVDLGRDAAMQAVREVASHSICVMPYLADNHPYAVLDVAFAGAVPLMVSAGGIPEMFSDQFRELLLAKSNKQALAGHLHHLLTLPVEQFAVIRTSFVSSMKQAQEGINERVRHFGASILPVHRSTPLSKGKATIIVPVFNTALSYIEELIFGINNQTLRPAEVIFVDDASAPDYHEQLQATVKSHLQVPYRVVRHAFNKGLAGARNTGVAATETEFVINIDSDDVPMNDFVRDIVAALHANNDHVAAVPYLAAFDDATPFNVLRFNTYTYRPLGDGVVASQIDNHLGHANAGFRTEAVREFGGWDESSKAMWEDWAFFLKLTSAGRKIAIIPKVGILYRVRAESMLRTYDAWPAMRRLANNMTGLPRYENYRMQAMMRSYGAIEQELAATRNQVANCRAELNAQSEVAALYQQQLNRRSVQAVQRIANRLSGHRSIFRVARATARISWKFGRGLRAIARSVGIR